MQMRGRHVLGIVVVVLGLLSVLATERYTARYQTLPVSTGSNPVRRCSSLRTSRPRRSWRAGSYARSRCCRFNTTPARSPDSRPACFGPAQHQWRARCRCYRAGPAWRGARVQSSSRATGSDRLQPDYTRRRLGRPDDTCAGRSRYRDRCGAGARRWRRRSGRRLDGSAGAGGGAATVMGHRGPVWFQLKVTGDITGRLAARGAARPERARRGARPRGRRGLGWLARGASRRGMRRVLDLAVASLILGLGSVVLLPLGLVLRMMRRMWPTADRLSRHGSDRPGLPAQRRQPVSRTRVQRLRRLLRAAVERALSRAAVAVELSLTPRHHLIDVDFCPPAGLRRCRARPWRCAKCGSCCGCCRFWCARERRS